MNQRPSRCVTTLAIALACGSSACVGSIAESSEGGNGILDPSGNGNNKLPRVGDTGTTSPPAAGGCEGGRSDEPFRVLIHRLTNSEYNHTVRDLLGDSSKPANDFPADGAINGFDNVPEGLFFSEQHAERLEQAAERLAWDAVNSGKIACSPATEATTTCARAALQPFVERAWRRPVTSEELDGVVAQVSLALTTENNFKQGLQLAVKRVLLSPHFLYRAEAPPDPSSSAAFRLNDFELASRLAYFLWSSMPDDRLFAAARAGKLRDAVELAAQVARMLADEKADALADNLAGQWLLTRKTQLAERPASFDAELRAGVQTETKLFLKAFLKEELSFLDILDAKFTFLTSRVARHYGIAGIQSKDAQRVSLSAVPQRGGLLTQANILVGTTPYNRSDTSVVQRGKWILTSLFCTPPPEPPPGADEFKGEVPPNATRKQREAAHSARPECAGCHVSMDAMGFALENYDPNGGWRERDGAHPVDATGEIPGIGRFTGAAELSALLKRDPRFPACVTNFVATQALGRPMLDERGGWLGDKERCAMQGLAADNARKGHRMSELVTTLVRSPIFTQQGQGERP